jgi:hypothetical protein
MADCNEAYTQASIALPESLISVFLFEYQSIAANHHKVSLFQNRLQQEPPFSSAYSVHCSTVGLEPNQ